MQLAFTKSFASPRPKVASLATCPRPTRVVRNVPNTNAAGRSAAPQRMTEVARGTGIMASAKEHREVKVMDFDDDAHLVEARNKAHKLKIGIVGFGNFGQFLGKRFAMRGHDVRALITQPHEDYREIAENLGVTYYTNADDFCEAHPEVVILCTSILSTQKVVEWLPMQRLKRSTLFMDVLSVKYFPKMLLQDILPKEVDLLCTHPMFGQNSGARSWKGLNFQFEKVRIHKGAERERRVEALLDVFRNEGCNMVDISCEEHDRQSASTQFVTHTVGRMLGAMKLESTPINTKGFEALLNLVEQTNGDSFDLYYGLFLYNSNAVDELERMEEAFEVIKQRLFGRLHEIARKQILPANMVEAETRKAEVRRALREARLDQKERESINDLKREALVMVANYIPAEEIGELRNLFRSMDGDNSGNITITELKDGLKRKGAKLNDDDVEVLISFADANKDGKVDYEEFLAACVQRSYGDNEDYLLKAFNELDKDGSGTISKDELAMALEVKGVSPEQIENIMAEVDKNGDGEIDYEEFQAMMRPNKKDARAKAWSKAAKFGIMKGKPQ